jgi:hypothetical protein
MRRVLELMAFSSLFYNSPMSVNLKISQYESKSRSMAKSRCTTNCGEKVYDREAMQKIEVHSPAYDKAESLVEA